MKRTLSFLFLLLFCITSYPQNVIQENCDFLETNNLKAFFCSGGKSYEKNNNYKRLFLEYPKNSGKYTVFMSSLWVAGMHNNKLYAACERYRQLGRDFYPGPVMNKIFYPSQFYNWNKVWKVSQAEIDAHMSNWNMPNYVVPNCIMNWPAHGNPLYGQAYYLAPFVDNDGDNIYNPGHGDYPVIRGEEAIYFIINDSAYSHTESNGKTLGIEIHGMAWEIQSRPFLRNTLFVNYLIYNRSNRPYDSLFVGLFSDIDIGDPWEDYIGCDTVNNMFFGYNALSYDGIAGQPGTYGANPPAQAVTFLNRPMTSFSYFNNTGSFWALTDPDEAFEYYLIMNSYWKDTSHMVYGGNGHVCCSFTPNILTNYMFSGYPGDTAQWSEIIAGNQPWDRRGVGIAGPLTLLPGQYISLDIAYIVADSGFIFKSSQFPNVDYMYFIVPEIREFFSQNYPADGRDIAAGPYHNVNKPEEEVVRIFPNPAKEHLYLSFNFPVNYCEVKICDLTGRAVFHGVFSGGIVDIDLSRFNNGMYFLSLVTSKSKLIRKFVKE